MIQLAEFSREARDGARHQGEWVAAALSKLLPEHNPPIDGDLVAVKNAQITENEDVSPGGGERVASEDAATSIVRPDRGSRVMPGDHHQPIVAETVG